MKTNYRHYPAALAIAVAVLAGSVRTDDAAGPLPAPEWKLVWSDEFDGNEIDRSKWDLDIGSGFLSGDGQTWISGWGNDELEYYTDEKKNAFIRDGMLHIRALKQPREACQYTSAKLKTRKRDGTELFSKTYGKFEFRAKLPTGQGIWPALWMLPQDEKKYGGWAASGEIDVMEARGQQPGKVLGTLHFGSRWPANSHAGKDHVLPRGTSIREFHVYALEWEPGEIRWYIDGKLFQTQSFWWSSSKSEGGKGANPAREADLNPWPAPFDQPFYLIMNLAVGGRFLGNPDSTTVFPAEMVVDYVRVYDNAKGYGQAAPRGPGKLPFATSRRP